MPTFEELMHQRAYEIPDRDCDRPIRVGVVGYSDPQKLTNMFWAESMIHSMLSKRVIDEIERVYGRCGSFDLVSGLTDVGIPGMSYHYVTENSRAKKYYGKTVGIACSKAQDYPQFPVDEKHIIGNDWGDESEFFIDYIDALVRIGGGDQSHREVDMFKSKYPEKPLLEVDL